MDYVYGLQQALSTGSTTEQEGLLTQAGISSTARINDLSSYIPVWTRTEINGFDTMSDQELLEQVPQSFHQELQTLTTRQQLIETVRELLHTSNSYDQCITEAQARDDLKLCPRGYCTAKEKFAVYPSAYANGYAVQVCQGTQPDYNGKYSDDYSTTDKPEDSDLARWYQEQWVNVCEYDSTTNTYAPCGRTEAKLDPQDYPYCRPLNKLPGTTVKTVNELTSEERQKMCAQKQSLTQGVDGQPTRVYLPSNNQ